MVKYTSIIYINKVKEKKFHIIISTDAKKKKFEKIQYPFMIKTSNKLGIEGNVLNPIMSIYEKPTAIIVHSRRLKDLPLRSGTR